jgi:hypothetical protein
MFAGTFSGETTVRCDRDSIVIIEDAGSGSTRAESFHPDTGYDSLDCTGAGMLEINGSWAGRCITTTAIGSVPSMGQPNSCNLRYISNPRHRTQQSAVLMYLY